MIVNDNLKVVIKRVVTYCLFSGEVQKHNLPGDAIYGSEVAEVG